MKRGMRAYTALMWYYLRNAWMHFVESLRSVFVYPVQATYVILVHKLGGYND